MDKVEARMRQAIRTALVRYAADLKSEAKRLVKLAQSGIATGLEVQAAFIESDILPEYEEQAAFDLGTMPHGKDPRQRDVEEAEYDIMPEDRRLGTGAPHRTEVHEFVTGWAGMTDEEKQSFVDAVDDLVLLEACLEHERLRAGGADAAGTTTPLIFALQARFAALRGADADAGATAGAEG